jgi:16S rRNA (uracil1498-N3)-methyltransferase
MPRFFCPVPLTIGAVIDLPETVAHHVFVLRLQKGDTIQLFNGEGGCYVASIAISQKNAQRRTESVFTEEVELPYSLTLAQALPEGSKMDWIIEKAMELGVSRFSRSRHNAASCACRQNGQKKTQSLARHHRRRCRAIRS